MMQPLPLDTALGEFSETSDAWVLQSHRQGTYLIVTDNRFPSRRPVRFFMSREDAERLLAEVLQARPSLAHERITPVSVKLLQACAPSPPTKLPAMPTASSCTPPTRCSSSSRTVRPAERRRAPPLGPIGTQKQLRGYPAYPPERCRPVPAAPAVLRASAAGPKRGCASSEAAQLKRSATSQAA